MSPSRLGGSSGWPPARVVACIPADAASRAAMERLTREAAVAV